ncbi:MAG: inositol monophosphatase family protein [Planctomycetaceae bacterium]
MDDVERILAVAVRAAREAGEILQAWSTRFTVSEKGPSDLVTEADLASQSAIVTTVTAAFPDHDLLGEENLSAKRGRSDVRWIIDPLDGTSNYVHRFPYYCVSIGVESGGRPVAGVVYDPNRDELFTAVVGGGTRLNGTPIHPTRTTRLDDAFLVASLPRRANAEDLAMQRFVRAVPRAESVQRTGSAALNLAYVACGRIDAFWSSSLKPWDMAAGTILVTEAGGRVSSISGAAFSVDRPEILASNGTELHESVVELLCATN